MAELEEKAFAADELLVSEQDDGADQPEQSQKEVHPVIVFPRCAVDNAGFRLDAPRRDS